MISPSCSCSDDLLSFLAGRCQTAAAACAWCRQTKIASAHTQWGLLRHSDFVSRGSTLDAYTDVGFDFFDICRFRSSDARTAAR